MNHIYPDFFFDSILQMVYSNKLCRVRYSPTCLRIKTQHFYNFAKSLISFVTFFLTRLNGHAI